MRKALFLLIICISILGIYHYTNRKEKLVFSIGNDEGEIYYKEDGLRITDIIIAIESNKEIEEYTIQHILVKATKVIIDLNEILYLNSYTGVLTQLKDLESLLELIRKYCKEKVEIKQLVEDSELAEYTNQKISILSKKYDILITR